MHDVKDISLKSSCIWAVLMLMHVYAKYHWPTMCDSCLTEVDRNFSNCWCRRCHRRNHYPYISPSLTFVEVGQKHIFSHHTNKFHERSTLVVKAVLIMSTCYSNVSLSAIVCLKGFFICITLSGFASLMDCFTVVYRHHVFSLSISLLCFRNWVAFLLFQRIDRWTKCNHSH